MKLQQTCTITAARDSVWDFLMGIENIAHCLDGIQEVTRIDDDTYEGILRVKVGPVSLNFQGSVFVESRDREQWRGIIRAEAKDRKRGGSVRALLEMELVATSPSETEMQVALETHILGKIGEFGQPLIRKKTGALLADFAENVSKQLTSS